MFEAFSQPNPAICYGRQTLRRKSAFSTSTTHAKLHRMMNFHTSVPRFMSVLNKHALPSDISASLALRNYQLLS